MATAAPTMHGRVIRGVAWKAGTAVVYQVTRLVVAGVLAHLLSPHDYGIAGMVLVFSSLIVLFSDLSFGTALVQRAHLTEQDRSTVFWTSVGAGLCFCAAGVALSGPIASFYGEPQVQPLFAALSVGFVVASISSTQAALLTREMEFRKLELREMASSLIAGGVGIVLAVKGYGPWAIIGQQIAVALVSATMLWFASPWRPHMTYSLASLRDLGGYSSKVFGARLLFYVNRNVDNLLIGRFLGPAALGAYAVAYNLMLMPLSQISLPLQDVLCPAFSRIQDEKRRIAAAWLRANRLVGAITIPAMLGLAAVAPEFVAVVLGDQWKAAVPVIQILAWVGLLQSLQGLNGSVLRAVDRTGTLLRYSVLVVVASLAALLIGLPYGITGVAIAYAISSTLVEPCYAALTARTVESSLWEYLRSLSGVAQAAVLMLGCLLGARLLLTAGDVGALARLAALITVGVAVYLPCLAWRAPEVLAELREIRRRGLAP